MVGFLRFTIQIFSIIPLSPASPELIGSLGCRRRKGAFPRSRLCTLSLSVLKGKLLRPKQYPSSSSWRPREDSPWKVLFFAWQPCRRIARLPSQLRPVALRPTLSDGLPLTVGYNVILEIGFCQVLCAESLFVHAAKLFRSSFILCLTVSSVNLPDWSTFPSANGTITSG